MGDAAVIYQGEAFAGDRLVIEVASDEPSRSGFRFFYRVTRSGDGKEIALAESGMVCFDYKEGKIKKLPDKVKKILFKSEGRGT